MGVLDFLFNGSPPESVNTYGTTVDSVPRWLSDYTQGLISRANSIGGEAYQPYAGPRIAGFTQPQQQAFQSVQSNQGSYQPGVNQATQMTANGAAVAPINSAMPYLNLSTSYLDKAMAPGSGGLTAAAPYLGNANKTFPGSADEYMNPYVGNVLNRASDLAMRTFNERLKPQMDDQFTASGQFGSSRHMEEMNKGVRDITENLQSQSQAALAGAYDNAGQMFQADAGRQGTLASIAGQLGVSDRSGMFQGANTAGQLGATAGDLATSGGDLQLRGGQQMGNLAELLQSLGFKDSAQLEAVGSAQQGLNQRNLDLGYQDFTAQRDYPRQTVDWLSSVIRGLPNQGGVQTTTSNGPASTYQPSPLASLASLFTGLRGYQQATAQQG